MNGRGRRFAGQTAIVLAFAWAIPSIEAFGQGRKGGSLGEFEAPFRDDSDRSSSDQDDSDDDDDYERDYSSSESGGGSLFVGSLRFDTYPYAREIRFLDLIRHSPNYFLTRSNSERYFAADFRSYYMRVEHDLDAYGVAGRGRSGAGVDVRFDVSQYRERIGGRTDRLTFHEYVVDLVPWPGPRNASWSFGAGAAVLEGEETHSGFLLQTGFEWFPAYPLSFRLSGGLATFETASITDLQVEARVHLHRFALSAGVRSLINSEGDDLTGVMLGIGIWF